MRVWKWKHFSKTFCFIFIAQQWIDQCCKPFFIDECSKPTKLSNPSSWYIASFKFPLCVDFIWSHVNSTQWSVVVVGEEGMNAVDKTEMRSIGERGKTTKTCHFLLVWGRHLLLNLLKKPAGIQQMQSRFLKSRPSFQPPLSPPKKTKKKTAAWTRGSSYTPPTVPPSLSVLGWFPRSRWGSKLAACPSCCCVWK